MKANEAPVNMTFICKEELEAMLLKEMNVAHFLAYGEGIIDNQGIIYLVVIYIEDWHIWNMLL